MATELYVRKLSGSILTPAANDDADVLTPIKNGTVLKIVVTVPRNYKFLKKFFSLCRLAYDAWSPAGGPKNFDVFRRDLLILAGFRVEYISLATQELRIEAESLAFASMDEARFRLVYKAVLDVIWSHICSLNPAWSRATLDRLAHQILEY